jgi:lipopolysaccharide transport system ATP-binding protein
MPWIEEFAEIGEYIEHPVRVYSSGMQMRLAFSVATARRPDILIVDEALSVGDAYFQHKSFDRIREFRKQGTTLLIVSHDKQAIQSICDRAILLGAGKLLMEGEPEAVMDYYNAMLTMDQPQSLTQTSTTAGAYQNTESGTSEAVIESVILKNTHGDILTTVSVGQEIEVHVQVQVRSDISSLVFGCGFKDRYGQMIFGTNTYHTKQELKNCKKGDRVVFVISCMANLGVGSYSMTAAIHAGDTHLSGNYHWIDRAFVFEVVNRDKCLFVGSSWNEMMFSVNLNGIMLNKQ